jgi:ketosteroid isomerase-like protein
MERSRLVVETAYALWEAGDVRSMMNCFSDNVAFAVHPPSSTSFVGQGQGRAVLKRRLERFPVRV